MPLTVTRMPAPCGALVTGVDLRAPLSPTLVADLRALWLAHRVIAFPEQPMGLEDLERFARALGPDGEDPFIAPIAGHPRIVEVRREAEETTPLFAESWHSDWSFLPSPPAGTLLYGTVIPPVGGDTLFADQCAACEALPAALRRRIEGRRAVHSARRGYARDGLYGLGDRGRSMAIRPSDRALKTQSHPLLQRHPETGDEVLFVNPGYTVGIEDMDDDEAQPLLRTLFAHQTEPRFVYRHTWRPSMLTLWDNRSVLHRATGGYDGHRRLLHRITIAAPVA